MSQRKLTKRADGRYKVNYGSRQFYGKTKAEAEKKRDQFIASEKAGLNHDLAETPFLEYALNWVSVYRAACGAPQQKQYAAMMEFTARQLKCKAIKDITVTELQAVVNMLAAYSSSYVSKFMTTLRGVFRTAAAEGAVLRNPMELVKRPKCKKTEGHRALEGWERDLITSTYQEHDFGLVAMVMLYAGLRRGEALFLHVDRDVDFEKKTITVNGAVSFSYGNQPVASEGKTASARRTVPLVRPLAHALQGHHGLLCTKKDGAMMSQSAFDRKFASYITFLETKLNGCPKRWYGHLSEHKTLIAAGKQLPPWRNVTLRCHDFRVDFCTRCYDARIPVKTLQSWMGHASAQMIMEIYSKLTKEEEEKDAARLAAYMEKGYEAEESNSHGAPWVTAC